MPRAIWKGALNFGLVNVPVGVYSATQDKAIHFNQFEEGTSDRIRYKKVNERTGQEVPAGRIVKGYDLGGGEYVLLTDEELEAAEPEKSRLIEITDFVDLDQIDPVYYRATYYLAPEGEAANKAYALLRQVMRNANKVAIGTVVMRNKEYPVTIRPDDDVLKLETMYFADEIRSPSTELPELPDASDLSDREVSMAELLLDSMASEWEPDKYHDTHRQKVEALIESKRQGNEIVTGTEVAPASTKVVDLMEVLSASIESVQAQRTGTETATGTGPAATTGRKTSRPAARTTPIKKTTSIKKTTPIKKAAKAAPARATSAKPAARSAKARPKAKPAPRRKAS
jgi:DNA end-binding protein Ku